MDNMTEIWKSVPDYGNKYEVSNFGRVKNKKGNCHTKCPEYKEWCIKHDEENALINSKKNEESEICKYIANRMYKSRKLKGKQ